ncbi:MAG: VanZ family protein [Bacteroidales bacterium]|nr:VanZ family protein [Bacteroidales bacterium]
MIKSLYQNKTLLKTIFCLWLIFIAIVSSLPNIPTQEINIWDEPFRLDYLEHFGVFAILFGLFVLWKSDKNGFFSVKKYYLFILGLLLFAVIDEIHQLWISGRSYNPLDLIYNLLGSISGMYFTKFSLRKIIKKIMLTDDTI